MSDPARTTRRLALALALGGCTTGYEPPQPAATVVPDDTGVSASEYDEARAAATCAWAAACEPDFEQAFRSMSECRETIEDFIAMTKGADCRFRRRHANACLQGYHADAGPCVLSEQELAALESTCKDGWRCGS